ncbi:MAG: TorD/DmsD family molecular chaperone [Endozoicomonas sp.]
MTPQEPQLLAGLDIACRFFYQAFHHAPIQPFLQLMKDEQLLEDWPLPTESDKVSEGIKLLMSCLEQGAEPSINAMTEDFADLFIGPNALKAAPWASVYLSEEQTTCGEATLGIKAFYREFGVEIDTGENEPEDHIGLIFAFLAHLTGQALENIEREEAAQPWLCASRSFLTDHVLTWVPRFLEILREQAQTDFYRGISLLAEGTLQQFAELVDAEYKIVRLYR